MVYKTMNNFFNLPSVGELKDKIERSFLYNSNIGNSKKEG